MGDYIITRRALAGLGLALAAPAALAQTPPRTAWPTQPVRLIVPYSAGGAVDLLGRALNDLLAPRLGQSLVVENLTGGGTTVAAIAARRAPADGHTILLATSTTLAVAPALFRNLGYDPVRDFVLAATVTTTPFALVVPRSGPADIQALIADAKRTGGRYTYASAGPGTPQHLSAAMFASAIGVEMVHVPYRGSAPAMPDLIGGRVSMMFCDLASAIGFIRSGELRLLGIATPARMAMLPDTPTMTELGFPGFEAVSWQALALPAGTPPAVLERLSAETMAALESEAGRARIESIGLLTYARPFTTLDGFVASEIARWAPVVRASGAANE
ncbi:Bug family tripartite tricarboxylate transporter substrate binding protein [Roseomonas chloroacetimidivorans]|uniref:Bug family tripartite tricarboxylate transporter substrate binding protein n=1 Tax=Roseomonas chloroacetimidivorans TaxID=1766656 RepID=UPI003C71C31B